jgi:hypothetical protein
MVLSGTHRYRIDVSADLSDSTSTPLVALELQRDGEKATYFGTGSATESAIDARFGRLGRVHVRFQPSGRIRDVHLSKRCRGDRATATVSAEFGTYVGTIRFRGEHGFTTVKADQAQGSIGDPLAGVAQEAPDCRPLHESQPFVSVTAVSKTRHLQFVAIAGRESPSALATTSAFTEGAAYLPSNDLPIFYAYETEEVDGMPIIRSAIAYGATDSVFFDFASHRRLEGVIVAPPLPFDGVGAFRRRGRERTSWEGALSVRLPGLGRLPLTGRHFQVKLKRPSS